MKCLVTGGGGFLGLAIVRLLRARGDQVVSYSRSRHEAVERLGARCEAGDVADARALGRSMRGVDCVFHVAAKAGVFGPWSEYAHSNVIGTTAVVAAAVAAKVPRLVFTSSPSVCFDGQDHVGAGNDLPYATRFLAHYPRSKMLAEKHVLSWNGRGIATTALRPHLIVGPGDPHLLTRVADRARRGKLVVVGDGRNQVSLTDVENAAWAHLDAAEALNPGAPHAGRAYFVAQGEPVALWPWIRQVLEASGLPGPRGRVPLAVARLAGTACEGWWFLSKRSGEPPMTRFVALQLARSHTYDMEPARRDFGYRERVSTADMTARATAWLGTEVAARRI
ncbi:MAG: NAD-dependent epimerase/dehydratase family protein [Planctomycetota bacterium]|nr:NAD-dependent epimerase/dehydratase family protein [Planctomycetota bacterium]